MKSCNVCKKEPPQFDGKVCWKCEKVITGKLKKFKAELEKALKNKRNITLELADISVKFKGDDE